MGSSSGLWGGPGEGEGRGVHGSGGEKSRRWVGGGHVPVPFRHGCCHPTAPPPTPSYPCQGKRSGARCPSSVSEGLALWKEVATPPGPGLGRGHLPALPPSLLAPVSLAGPTWRHHVHLMAPRSKGLGVRRPRQHSRPGGAHAHLFSGAFTPTDSEAMAVTVSASSFSHFWASTRE